MTKPLIRLSPLTPKAWVHIQLLPAKRSKETRRKPTLYRSVKGLDSKDVKRREAVLEGAEGAEGEVTGVVVIGKEILGVQNGGMQQTHSPQIICN